MMILINIIFFLVLVPFADLSAFEFNPDCDNASIDDRNRETTSISEETTSEDEEDTSSDSSTVNK